MTVRASPQHPAVTGWATEIKSTVKKENTWLATQSLSSYVDAAGRPSMYVHASSAELSHCFSLPESVMQSRAGYSCIAPSLLPCTRALAQDLGAVILHNMNLLAVVVQLPSPPSLLDQKILYLVAVQTDDERACSLSRGWFSCLGVMGSVILWEGGKPAHSKNLAQQSREEVCRAPAFNQFRQKKDARVVPPALTCQVHDCRP